jgi:mono/diheme cytochrome c family protein
VWNGRSKPTMPAFKSQLTKNDVWLIVEYVKTLRN